MTRSLTGKAMRATYIPKTAGFRVPILFKAPESAVYMRLEKNIYEKKIKLS